MHRYRQSILATALIVLGLLAAIDTEAAKSAAWRSLGKLHVSDRVDKDTLRVGVKKGTFNAIRLQVEGRAVQFRDLKIHFENGDVQDVALRSVIRRGRFSRTIDLDGGRRAIDRIVFIYDAQTLRRGKGARVEVFGRK